MITDDRLNDARRILGLKAKYIYLKSKHRVHYLKNEDQLSVIGCDEHLTMQQEAADLSITLVKNTLDQLPIRPETHKNIRLYIIEGEKNGIYKSDDTVEHNLAFILEDRGFNDR